MTTQPENDTKKPAPYISPILSFLLGIGTATLGFVSGVLDREVEDRAVDVEIMRVAFDVLQLPKEQSGETYRTWACEVLNTHTEPDLNCAAADAANAVLSELSEFNEFPLGATSFGDPSLTDINLFVCDDAEVDQARIIADTLRNEGFGNIRLAYWNLFEEVSREELSGQISIILDYSHPEYGELNRITSALERTSINSLQTFDNRGPLSPWLISIVACDL